LKRNHPRWKAATGLFGEADKGGAGAGIGATSETYVQIPKCCARQMHTRQVESTKEIRADFAEREGRK